MIINDVSHVLTVTGDFTEIKETFEFQSTKHGVSFVSMNNGAETESTAVPGWH